MPKKIDRPAAPRPAKPRKGVQEIQASLPVLALRDAVVFPGCVAPLVVHRPSSLAAVEAAVAADKKLILLLQRNPEVDTPGETELYTVGTVAEIIQIMRLPDGDAKVLVEGQTLVTTQRVTEEYKYLKAEAAPRVSRVKASRHLTALTRLILRQFESYVNLTDRVPTEMYLNIRNMVDSEAVANSVSHYSAIRALDKQILLETEDVEQRLVKLGQFLVNEIEMLEAENKILAQVKHQIGRSQREYFLNEQLKAIERELGVSNDDDAELDELSAKVEKSRMSDEARERAQRELSRLSKMSPLSPEATVSRTYVETLVELPWGRFTKDKLDLDRAQRILDEDHFGLTKAKDRILEYLAVHSVKGRVRGPILCLVGPPGVGKTSLASSVARALGRKFHRLSLGGVRDEAEIRGHRRTYIGSLPGKVIQCFRKAGSMNPVLLLDEIDKMSSDFRGDPASALLEVLDPEQNSTFSDHYLEVDFDLSSVFFITTANSQSDIPLPLLDRLEIIRIPGYSDDEKQEIARRHLIPKQIQANGLSETSTNFLPDAIKTIVHSYTREAGVRNLEREIAKVCRRLIREQVSANRQKSGDVSEVVDRARVINLLGPEVFHDMDLGASPEVGLALGLAWTEVGGELLPCEVTVMPGKGQLILTGKLGEVMQESAKAAVSFIRSNATRLQVSTDFQSDRDIHIHLPEGAIPKDGPSAGITLTTALVSALTGRYVRQDIAMTGEVTLRGRVLKIGGLKEKALAAHRHGVRQIIIPADNVADLAEINPEIRQEIEFHPVHHVDEVLALMLVDDRAILKPKKGGGQKRIDRKRPGVPSRA